MTDKERREKKLYYRSVHRGCKETDILYTRIVTKMLPAENEEILALLERFCDEDDANVYAWFQHRAPFPECYPAWFIEQLERFVSL